MARANAASVAAHAGARRELAGTTERHAPAGLGSPRAKSLDIWVRRGVPAAVALFIGVLVAITATATRDSYDRTVSDALTDLELLAAVVADDLRDSLKQTPSGDIGAALADAVPSRALARGAQVLVADPAGDIVASAPASPGVKGSLNDYLGAAQPLTIFAEKAGVLRINLGDGSDALATVRSLRAPFGQVAIVYPMAAVVAEWRAAAFR